MTYIGCVTYRGYFRESSARELADALRDQMMDVVVTPTTAYSTLGWSNDPILNTMIGYDELDLAELVFHELTHALIYVEGDAAFSEALATTIGRIGAERYALEYALLDDLTEWRDWQRRRESIDSLLSELRTALMRIYGMNITNDGKLRRKADAIAEFRREFAQRGLGDPERWYASSGPNNAHLALHQTYTGHVDTLLTMFRQANSVQDFLAHMTHMASLPSSHRQKMLASGATQLANGDVKDAVQDAEKYRETEKRGEKSYNDAQLH